jgi:hypothetical protein
MIQDFTEANAITSELWALLEQSGLRVDEITTAIDERFSDGRRWLRALAIK